MTSRPDAHSSRVMQHFFTEQGISPIAAMTMQNMGLIMQAVAGGAGAALLPSQPLIPMGMNGMLTYLHVDTQEKPMQVGVMYRHGYALNKIEKAFIEKLREAYRMCP